MQAADSRPRLTINVLADGMLLVASRPITADDLVGLLRERKATHGDELEVRIRADRSVLYSRVEPVLLACVQAGIWNVAYAVNGFWATYHAVLLSTLFVYFNRPVTIRPRVALFRSENLEL